MISASDRKAFVFRIKGSRGCKVKLALEEDEIMIGWSKAKNLLDENLTQDDMRDIIHKAYFKRDKNQIRSGRAASQMWCFIREMEIGSYVVVPRGKKFYICRITSEPYFDQNMATVDASYRRKAQWMNYKIPIPRDRASKALQDSMKVSRKCIEITELMEDIIYSMRTL